MVDGQGDDQIELEVSGREQIVERPAPRGDDPAQHGDRVGADVDGLVTGMHRDQVRLTAPEEAADVVRRTGHHHLHADPGGAWEAGGTALHSGR